MRCFKKRSCLFALLPLVLAVSVSACEPEIHTRGNMLPQSKISDLRAGSTTRAQVTSLLGTPSTTSLFDEGETWFYIGSRTRQVALHSVEEVERQVLAVSFDKQGLLAQVKSLNKEDGTEITLVERTTPTAGNELTLMEQFMGNIGRFSGSSEKNPSGVTRKTGGY